MNLFLNSCITSNEFNDINFFISNGKKGIGSFHSTLTYCSQNEKVSRTWNGSNNKIFCPLEYAYATVDFAAYAGHFTIWVTFEFVSKFDLLMATPAFKYNPQWQWWGTFVKFCFLFYPSVTSINESAAKNSLIAPSTVAFHEENKQLACFGFPY